MCPVADKQPRVTEIGRPEDVDGRRHPVATGIAMASLLLVLGLTWVGFTSAVDDADKQVEVTDVEVPVLWGRTEEEARKMVEGTGLIMVVEEIPNDVFPLGVVFSQRPIAGAIVEQGSSIIAMVSTGSAGPIVPETVGQQAAEAAALLAANGLISETDSVNSEEVRVGEVVASSPRAGERSGPSMTVVLKVSIGPAPRVVPAAVGLPAEDVLQELGRLELVPVVTHRYQPGTEVGTVVSVSPVAQSSVQRGSDVKLVVSSPKPTVRVPGVTGLLEETAMEALVEADLQPVVRRVRIPSGDTRNGRVVSQGIILDSDVPAATSVEILIGIDPTPPPATTSTVAPP